MGATLRPLQFPRQRFASRPQPPCEFCGRVPADTLPEDAVFDVNPIGFGVDLSIHIGEVPLSVMMAPD
jgi:hypothetical protein